jgi:predicted RND superfamily exporter protein
MPVSLSVLHDLEDLENYLHKDYGIGFLISPVTIVKGVNKALNGGRKEKFALPENDLELHKIYKLLDRFKSSKSFGMVCADGGKTLRISGKSEDFGSMIFREKNKNLDAFFTAKMDTSKMNYHITGTASLIDKNNAEVAGGIVWGLLISFGVIAIIVGLMFWDWRMIILSLIPNIIPILMIGGLMGAFGIDLKVSTSMIFTISFGIAVDDTIHFISRLRIELSRGLTMSQAIRQTFLTTGKAIVLTTIVLSGGFLTLVFSEFLGTFYLGLLVGLTLIFAVIGDLILLPALLMTFMPDKKSKVE